MEKMGIISQSLADLAAAVGEENVELLPSLSEIEFRHQNQIENAFKFKLLYGTVSGNRNIWIYLLAHEHQDHEIHFGLSDRKGDNLELWFWNDQPKIKTIGDFQTVQTAFQDIVGFDLVLSLAKCIFLMLMFEFSYENEYLKAPFDMAGAWVAALKTVCSDFKRLMIKEAERQEQLPWSSFKYWWEHGGHHTMLKPFLGDQRIKSRNGESYKSISMAYRRYWHEKDIRQRMSSSPLINGHIKSGNDDSGSPATVVGLTRIPDDEQIIGTVALNKIPGRVPRSEGLLSPLMTQSIPYTEALASTVSSTHAGFRSRDKDIEAFQRMRHDGITKLKLKKQVVASKAKRLKMMRQLQDEINMLDKQESDINKALQDNGAHKRQLLQSMPVDEQMEFIFKAGQASATKHRSIE